MSRKATEDQRKSMSRLFRGTGIFKPLNTGRIDAHVHGRMDRTGCPLVRIAGQ